VIVLQSAGAFFAFGLQTVRAIGRRPFAWRELIQQGWLVARVTAVPAVLVALAVGAVLSLQLGGAARQLGAGPLTDSAEVLAIVREAAPIVTALVIAAAAGPAICADLGARKAGHEVDSMAVLGIDPVQRLVVPRVLASAGVAVLVNGLVTAAGLAGAGAVRGGQLTQLADLTAGTAKALVFGFLGALIAAYRGLAAETGPRGIADAVASSVLAGVLALLAANAVLSAVYFQLVPARGS
jgi:phospholipid/cholesterol/gamma-HCH transport system permease protein